MDAPLLYLDLFGSGPSSHLGYGGTGRRAECRGSVRCRSLEQLVVAARGLRDRRAIREASARDRGSRIPTLAVRSAGAKLKTWAVYQRSDIVLSHGKPIPRNGNGEQA